MSGRRSHPRFMVRQPWDGAMRVLRDVVIDQTNGNELLAVSQAPGVTDEEMSLELLGGGLSLRLQVRVLESRPVIVGDAVRHKLRLSVVTAPDPAQVVLNGEQLAPGAGCV